MGLVLPHENGDILTKLSLWKVFLSSLCSHKSPAHLPTVQETTLECSSEGEGIMDGKEEAPFGRSCYACVNT
jgi:hypothetical protein